MKKSFIVLDIKYWIDHCVYENFAGSKPLYITVSKEES